MNQQLIKDLREGRIAVKNDGTLEELNKVLRTAFPDAGNTNGIYPYFCKCRLDGDDWIAKSTTNLPYYSVKDFLNSKKYTIEEINNNKDILVIIESENQFNKLKSLGLKLWSKYCGHYYYIPSTGALFHNDLKLKSNQIVLTYSDIIMKKNINDYIGQKYAVQCSSKEEWQAILDLAPDKLESKENHYKTSNKGYLSLLSFGYYWNCNNKNEMVNNGWSVLKASDFLDTTTEKTLPRVMLVSYTSNIKNAIKRVIFAIERNNYIGWSEGETIEDSNQCKEPSVWHYAWELDELTIFPFRLTPTDAQSIIDIACNTWKVKLAEKWAVSIVKKESITISEQEYTEMYSACTDEQKELFDKIFK